MKKILAGLFTLAAVATAHYANIAFQGATLTVDAGAVPEPGTVSPWGMALRACKVASHSHQGCSCS